MAERIDCFTPKQGSGNSKYPWHEWADGSSWLLVRGEDYTVSDRAMQSVVHEQAKRTGKKARTQTTERGLLVQFTKPKKPLAVKKLKNLPRHTD